MVDLKFLRSVSFELADIMFSLWWFLFLKNFFVPDWGNMSQMIVVLYLNYPLDHQQMQGELAKPWAYYLYAI